MPALITSQAGTPGSAGVVAAPVNYVLMRGLLMAARKKLPFFNGTLPGTLEKNQGAVSVKWRRIENLAPVTSPLGEVTGTAVPFLGRNAVQPVITDIVAAIAKWGNYITYNEELDLFNVNTRAMSLMDALGANAGESLNIAMQAVFDTATQVRNANNAASVAALTTTMALADIKYAYNLLNRNSAPKAYPEGNGSTNIGTSPIRASYYGICHSDLEEDIRLIPGFLSVEQYGGYTRTMEGEFGAVSGVRWSSTELGSLITPTAATAAAAGFRATGAAPNDVYASYIYGEEAIGTIGLGEQHAKDIYSMYDAQKPKAVELIKKDLGSGGTFDPYNEIGSIAWKSWFAGKLLNPNWVVKVNTLSTKL